MRKIETPEEKERRRKRNSMLAGSIMLFVLVLGTIGFAFSFNSGTQQTSNNPAQSGAQSGNTGFDNSLGKWGKEINGQMHYFLYSPEEVSDVNVELYKSLSDLSGRPLYIDSVNSAANAEIAANLGSYTLRMQEACYKECEKNLPIKSCTDNIIIIKESNESRVYQEDNCYFILGGVRETDAFLHKILGIS